MSRRSRGSATRITPEMRVKALYDYWAFLDLIGFHGGTKNFAACHYEAALWSTRLDGKRRKLHLLPRGHLKSTLFSVGKTLWRLYQNPNIRRFEGTSSRELSTAFIREVRAYLEDAYLQEQVWNVRPHIPGNLIPTMDRMGRSRRDWETEAQDKKIIWRSDALQVLRDEILKEPSVVAGSVGSVATGFHFDEIVFDDIITFDNSDTIDKRERVFSWIHDIESVLDPPFLDEQLAKALMNVGVPEEHAMKIADTGGVVDVLGTRYDKEDYYGVILEQYEELGFEIFSRNIYINGEDSSDGYLWPGRMNEAYEKQLRASMSSRRFASQYLNKVLVQDELILKPDNIQYFTPAQIHLNNNGYVEYQRVLGEPMVQIKPHLVVDPAASVSKKADFTAIGVGGKDQDGRLFLFDYRLGRWQTSEWIKLMFQLCEKWNLNVVHVETCGFQVSLISTIRSYFPQYKPLSIIPYKPRIQVGGRDLMERTGNDNPSRKKARIEHSLQPLFENGMFYATWSLSRDTKALEQLEYFPRETIHDDFPDMLQMLNEVSKKPVGSMMQHNRPKTYQFYNRKYGGLR